MRSAAESKDLLFGSKSNAASLSWRSVGNLKSHSALNASVGLTEAALRAGK